MESILLGHRRVRSGDETIEARYRRIGQERFVKRAPAGAKPLSRSDVSDLLFWRATAKYRGCGGTGGFAPMLSQGLLAIPPGMPFEPLLGLDPKPPRQNGSI